MKGNDRLFIWGDNWWIEGDQAWFVWGMENILFCINLNSGKCESAVCIPDDNPVTFRLNPYCIKSGNNILCMPGLGKSIWVYDSECLEFSRIDIDNPGKGQLALDFWVCDDTLWVVSSGNLKKIIEISINQKKIKNYYTICEEGSLSKSIKVNNTIYSLATDSNKVYEFNLMNKMIRTHILPDITGRLWTICFDGEKFWLSGFQRQLYAWNKKTNEVNVITDFPHGFGVYDFKKETTTGDVDSISYRYECHAFNFSVTAGNKVWFIPYKTNKIVYIAKGENELHAFEIAEENETKESIMARTALGYKYLLEYVKNDRYIGLFSIKNNCMLEIDAVEMSYEYKQYDYYVGNALKCIKERIEQRYGLFYEQIPGNKKVYWEFIRTSDNKVWDVKESNIGKNIYRTVTADVREGSI